MSFPFQFAFPFSLRFVLVFVFVFDFVFASPSGSSGTRGHLYSKHSTRVEHGVMVDHLYRQKALRPFECTRVDRSRGYLAGWRSRSEVLGL
jgi:hypothetical protein